MQALAGSAMIKQKFVPVFIYKRVVSYDRKVSRTYGKGLVWSKSAADIPFPLDDIWPLRMTMKKYPTYHKLSITNNHFIHETVF